MPFTFIYSLTLGRDCFMMGDCGYQLVLSPDGLLRRFDDRGEVTSSVTLTSEEQAALRDQLERGGFFDLPMHLPVVSGGEVILGGRTVSMRFESTDGSADHQVDAYTDPQSAPLPETFYSLDEAVRSFLLERLGE